ncbi:hypothetical protein B0J13DRAFT_550713 [Dactylonectria estremocensis]|uniref:BTB domain-containing protein n=1 Tax=Dactylonectria estremocensis TaxID=1079267 RepID=A0A9P9J5N3_9HYPO|nr:hypothetical protein B0J13DRAFT_550713 [Dactylonectria estremocensis]
MDINSLILSTMKLDLTTAKALQSSLISAESGVYSDLLIKCGTDEYYVHKILLCTRSPFFAKACDGPFKEGQSGEIDLPDDDPEAVASMICYLYRGCYPRVEADAERPQEKRLGSPWNAETYGEETISLQDEYLCLHAKVYAIAEKYQVSGLKEMALRNFSFLVPRTISPHNFAEASEIAYTMTIDSDRGLRDLVVEVLFSKSQFLEDEALKKLLKRLPDLTYDYVMYQHRKKEGNAG